MTLNRLSQKREYVATKLSFQNNQWVESDANVASSFLYDAAGNLTRTTDGDGLVVGYDYNGLGQRTAENWFTNSSATSPTNTISYDYKDAGELQHATDAFASGGNETFKNSKYTFVTDALGRVTSVDNNGGSTSGTVGVPDVVLNAKYDLNGNRTALNAQVDVGQGLNDDFQNSYAFDRLNRLTSVIQTAAGTSGHYGVGYKKTAFTYYNDSRLQTITDSNATATVVTGSLSYDHDSRLTGLSWYGPGAGYGGSSGYFEQLGWTYDNDSRVGTMSNGVYSNENLTYTYDHDSQLTSAAASYGGYGGGYGGGTYSWDGNGDPTGKTMGRGNRLLSDGTYRYEYDNSGHMTKRTAISGGAYTVYTWDNRGRLTSATDKNSSGTILQVVSNTYDAFNDLIGRSFTPYVNGNPGATATSRFVYDLTGSMVDLAPDPSMPGNPAAGAGQGNAVLAFNGNGSLTDRYVWGPAVDEILADERYSPSGSNVMPSTAGSVYWALTDNENSVRDWIAYGSLVDHVIYDSFGKIFSQSSTSVPFAFMHNGVFYDPATGLEYHSQPGSGIEGRWYMPSIQRWMSEDPTGLAFDSDPYRYNDNSPTNGVDPSGQADCPSNVKFPILPYTPATTDDGRRGFLMPRPKTYLNGKSYYKENGNWYLLTKHVVVSVGGVGQPVDAWDARADQLVTDDYIVNQLEHGPVINVGQLALDIRDVAVDIATPVLASVWKDGNAHLPPEQIARNAVITAAALAIFGAAVNRVSSLLASATNPEFSAAEKRIAEYIEENTGLPVTKNLLEGARGAGRQGDAYIAGLKHEFKSCEVGATSSTIRNEVNSSIKRGGQARTIVIDARGSGLTKDEALRGLGRAAGISRGKIDNIIIIGDDYFIGRTVK